MTDYTYRGKPYLWYPADDTGLFEIATQYLPQVLWAIEGQKDINDWVSEIDWSAGLTELLNIQWELLMGSAVETLQMEIRAMRGVDDLSPDIFDPAANPFELSLGTIEDNKRAVEAGNAKLEEIRLLIAEMQTDTSLEDIQAKVAQIAILLG